jgi:hypothetical protein
MKLCQSNGLNLHPLVEDDHASRRDKKKNKNAPGAAPDMAKEFAAPRRAGFPLSLDPNPFIFYACSDFHSSATAPFVPLHYPA